MNATLSKAPWSEPFERFSELFARAQQLPKEWFPEPNAMSVATVGSDGQPANRILLLKAFDERGFVFYTNFNGRKGQELLANPKAALCFYWAPLEVQVRVEGTTERVTDKEADAYFASRARGSQIGAWASLQSQPMDEFDDLEHRVAEFERKFEGKTVPRPLHWSGFRVVPHQIEFWHGGLNRLHNRYLYRRDQSAWRVEMLYP